MLALLVSLAFGASCDDAKQVARKRLDVDFVEVAEESPASCFVVTGLEYRDGDVHRDRPCVRGVVVEKKTLRVVDPGSDRNVTVFFDYAKTVFEDFTVVNCAI